jgi:hypothetical protein
MKTHIIDKGLLFGVIVLVIFLTNTKVVSQTTSSYDGIKIEEAEFNKKQFIYGEPISIYLKYSNTKAEINYYHKPMTYVNIKFFLKNITSGEVFDGQHHAWGSAGWSRDEMKKKPPSDRDSYFLPGESVYFPIPMGQFFGVVQLSDKKLYHNDITYSLRTVPIGEYELIFEYYLYPVDKKLTNSYTFKVLPVPDGEKTAFEKYIESSEYACNAHFDGNGNYSATHVLSYENFLQKFPNSVYSDHAYLNMVTESYYYAKGGPSISQRIEKFKEFLNYYGNIKNKQVKLEYIFWVPEFIKFVYPNDMHNQLDKFLKSIKNEDPKLSGLLIILSEERHQVMSLKNYAQERVDNEDKR